MGGFSQRTSNSENTAGTQSTRETGTGVGRETGGAQKEFQTVFKEMARAALSSYFRVLTTQAPSLHLVTGHPPSD